MAASSTRSPCRNDVAVSAARAIDLPPPGPGASRTRRVMPGFGLTLGYTLAWLSLIVLIPLTGVFVKSSALGWDGLWRVWTDARVLAALKLSFGTALAAGAFNTVFGTLVAWVLVRYRFPGRRLLDGLIDLPFALPTAVAGIALTALYAGNGWVGQWLLPLGIKVAYAPQRHRCRQRGNAGGRGRAELQLRQPGELPAADVQ